MKYILPQNEFDELKNQKNIKQFIDLLIGLFLLKNSDLLVKSRKDIDSEIEIVEGFRRSTINLLNLIRSEDGLEDFLLLDIISIEKKLDFLNDSFKLLRNKRAGQQKSVYNLLRFIFWEMQYMKIGQTKQIKFIFTLFHSYDYDNYGKVTKTNIESFFDRIRKMQERAIREIQ